METKKNPKNPIVYYYMVCHDHPIMVININHNGLCFSKPTRVHEGVLIQIFFKNG